MDVPEAKEREVKRKEVIKSEKKTKKIKRGYKDEKRRKKKPQKQRQKGSNQSCGCFNSSIQMARTLAENFKRHVFDIFTWQGHWQVFDTFRWQDTSRKFEITRTTIAGN